MSVKVLVFRQKNKDQNYLLALIADLSLTLWFSFIVSPLTWTSRPGDKQSQMWLKRDCSTQERGKKRGQKVGKISPPLFSSYNHPPSKAPSSPLTVVGKCVFDREKYIFTLGLQLSANSYRGLERGDGWVGFWGLGLSFSRTCKSLLSTRRDPVLQMHLLTLVQWRGDFTPSSSSCSFRSSCTGISSGGGFFQFHRQTRLASLWCYICFFCAS